MKTSSLPQRLLGEGWRTKAFLQRLSRRSTVGSVHSTQLTSLWFVRTLVLPCACAAQWSAGLTPYRSFLSQPSSV